MRIYLDVSCLSRPFDDQAQDRVRIEAEAVRLILARCASGEWQHVSSEMAIMEAEANPDSDKRRKIRLLLPDPENIMPNSEAIFRRAERLARLGLKGPDAVHVAAAEAQRADVLLTCDDRLLRAARRLRLPVGVANPASWLQEQQDAQNT